MNRPPEQHPAFGQLKIEIGGVWGKGVGVWGLRDNSQFQNDYFADL